MWCLWDPGQSSIKEWSGQWEDFSPLPHAHAFIFHSSAMDSWAAGRGCPHPAPSSFLKVHVYASFQTFHQTPASYWAHPNYLRGVSLNHKPLALAVNFIQQLELGKERTLEVWAGFEKFWSRSASILLAWRPNPPWQPVLISRDSLQSPLPSHRHTHTPLL